MTPVRVPTQLDVAVDDAGQVPGPPCVRALPGQGKADVATGFGFGVVPESRRGIGEPGPAGPVLRGSA
ncbi:hypothetical protein GCM10020221_11770 [Streptomyces thioluteus]|uniref:Uncharacterized protein n=1 Tax=Streptomyces thioluteus TaxID=66431 RepID=A0ABN3WLJ5_STRTU